MATQIGYRIRARPTLVYDIEMLKAMADETRSRILRLLCTPDKGEMKPMTVTEIALNFDLTASTVSHHLQLLKRTGLVTVERRGKERYYSLDFESLRQRVGQFNQLLSSMQTMMERADDDELA